MSLLITSSKTEMTARIGKSGITDSKNVKLLGITIDSELNFEMHLKTLCAKVSRKINALSHVFVHILC